MRSGASYTFRGPVGRGNALGLGLNVIGPERFPESYGSVIEREF